MKVHKFYTVYRTQNILNGKYYFGVHKTKDPYDRYLGSGTILKRAIAKYGEQAFIKNVCFIIDNPAEAFAKEFELIEEYRSDPLCYNLRQGGSGGFDYINSIGRNTVGSSKGAQNTKVKFRTDPVFRVKKSAASARNIRSSYKPEYQILATAARVLQWKGGKHSDETKALMSAKQTGASNSMFGMKWIHSVELKESKRVHSVIVGEYLSSGWCLGRRMRFN